MATIIYQMILNSVSIINGARFRFQMNGMNE